MSRMFVLFGCLTIFLLAGHNPSPAQGTKKEDNAKINPLQKTLKERDATIQKLQQHIKQLEADARAKTPAKKTTAQLQQELDRAQQTIRDKDQLIATLQQGGSKANAALSKEVESLRKTVRDLEAVKKARLVHAMILKQKKEDADQVKQIVDHSSKTLARIDGVRGFWIGRPANMGTPAQNYQLGVLVLLDDAAALQKFLDDPLHRQFSERLTDAWEPPLVYDIQREAR